MADGTVLGEDMWLQLEPLDPAADLTVPRTCSRGRRAAEVDPRG
jgi:hypothetical protein